MFDEKQNQSLPLNFDYDVSSNLSLTATLLKNMDTPIGLEKQFYV
jgi:hypothetical protein